MRIQERELDESRQSTGKLERLNAERAVAYDAELQVAARRWISVVQEQHHTSLKGGLADQKAALDAARREGHQLRAYLAALHQETQVQETAREQLDMGFHKEQEELVAKLSDLQKLEAEREDAVQQLHFQLQWLQTQLADMETKTTSKYQRIFGDLTGGHNPYVSPLRSGM